MLRQWVIPLLMSSVLTSSLMDAISIWISRAFISRSRRASSLSLRNAVVNSLAFAIGRFCIIIVSLLLRDESNRLVSFSGLLYHSGIRMYLRSLNPNKELSPTVFYLTALRVAQAALE